MKRALLFSTALLLLAGCGGSSSVSYHLTFSTQDPSERAQLLLMVQHVIERRLESMGEKGTIDNLQPVDDGANLTVSLGSSVVADALTSQLTETFDLQVMKQATDPLKSDITVEGHGSFSKTGIDGTMVTWIKASPQGAGPSAMVTIGLTPDGRTQMQKLFKENKGKYVGVFVRRKLVSKLMVQTTELKDDVVIQDIPSYDLASAFADDVNVGLHVTFEPRS